MVNSLHNVLVAVVITGYATRITTRKCANVTFMIALLQPFGLFTSIVWRDSVGQLFLVTGAILIFEYRSGIADLLRSLVGLLLVTSLRNIYILPGIFALFMRISRTEHRNQRTYLRSLLILVFAPIILLCF